MKRAFVGSDDHDQLPTKWPKNSAIEPELPRSLVLAPLSDASGSSDKSHKTPVIATTIVCPDVADSTSYSAIKETDLDDDKDDDIIVLRVDRAPSPPAGVGASPDTTSTTSSNPVLRTRLDNHNRFTASASAQSASGVGTIWSLEQEDRICDVIKYHNLINPFSERTWLDFIAASEENRRAVNFRSATAILKRCRKIRDRINSLLRSLGFNAVPARTNIPFSPQEAVATPEDKALFGVILRTIEEFKIAEPYSPGTWEALMSERAAVDHRFKGITAAELAARCMASKDSVGHVLFKLGHPDTLPRQTSSTLATGSNPVAPAWTPEEEDALLQIIEEMRIPALNQRYWEQLILNKGKQFVNGRSAKAVYNRCLGMRERVEEVMARYSMKGVVQPAYQPPAVKVTPYTELEVQTLFNLIEQHRIGNPYSRATWSHFIEKNGSAIVSDRSGKSLASKCVTLKSQIEPILRAIGVAPAQPQLISVRLTETAWPAADREAADGPVASRDLARELWTPDEDHMLLGLVQYYDVKAPLSRHSWEALVVKHGAAVLRGRSIQSVHSRCLVLRERLAEMLKLGSSKLASTAPAVQASPGLSSAAASNVSLSTNISTTGSASMTPTNAEPAWRMETDSGQARVATQLAASRWTHEEENIIIQLVLRGIVTAPFSEGAWERMLVTEYGAPLRHRTAKAIQLRTSISMRKRVQEALSALSSGQSVSVDTIGSSSAPSLASLTAKKHRSFVLSKRWTTTEEDEIMKIIEENPTMNPYSDKAWEDLFDANGGKNLLPGRTANAITLRTSRMMRDRVEELRRSLGVAAYIEEGFTEEEVQPAKHNPHQLRLDSLHFALQQLTLEVQHWQSRAKCLFQELQDEAMPTFYEDCRRQDKEGEEARHEGVRAELDSTHRYVAALVAQLEHVRRAIEAEAAVDTEHFNVGENLTLPARAGGGEVLGPSEKALELEAPSVILAEPDDTSIEA